MEPTSMVDMEIDLNNFHEDLDLATESFTQALDLSGVDVGNTQNQSQASELLSLNLESMNLRLGLPYNKSIRVSTESFLDKAKDILSALVKTIQAMITKMISFVKGLFGHGKKVEGDLQTTSEQIKDNQDELNQKYKDTADIIKEQVQDIEAKTKNMSDAEKEVHDKRLKEWQDIIAQAKRIREQYNVEDVVAKEDFSIDENKHDIRGLLDTIKLAIEKPEPILAPRLAIAFGGTKATNILTLIRNHHELTKSALNLNFGDCLRSLERVVGHDLPEFLKEAFKNPLEHIDQLMRGFPSEMSLDRIFPEVIKENDFTVIRRTVGLIDSKQFEYSLSSKSATSPIEMHFQEVLDPKAESVIKENNRGFERITPVMFEGLVKQFNNCSFASMNDKFNTYANDLKELDHRVIQPAFKTLGKFDTTNSTSDVRSTLNSSLKMILEMIKLIMKTISFLSIKIPVYNIKLGQNLLKYGDIMKRDQVAWISVMSKIEKMA
jgi:uncharacterized membrane-anchored protein YhcB (DUF1043 family)